MVPLVRQVVDWQKFVELYIRARQVLKKYLSEKDTLAIFSNIDLSPNYQGLQALQRVEVYPAGVFIPGQPCRQFEVDSYWFETVKFTLDDFDSVEHHDLEEIIWNPQERYFYDHLASKDEVAPVIRRYLKTQSLSKEDASQVIDFLQGGYYAWVTHLLLADNGLFFDAGSSTFQGLPKEFMDAVRLQAAIIDLTRETYKNILDFRERRDSVDGTAIGQIIQPIMAGIRLSVLGPLDAESKATDSYRDLHLMRLIPHYSPQQKTLFQGYQF